MTSTAKKMTVEGPVDATVKGAPANEQVPISSEALLKPEQRLARSRMLLAEVGDIWSDLRAQTTEDRKASSGKAAARMVSPLRSLFQLAASPSWAPVFGALGVSQDAEHHVPFDAAQLLARADRYTALQALQVELKALSALVADDLLHQGAQLVAAGKPAIGLARTLAKSNPTFRGKVATILNDLTAMTAGARSGGDDEEVAEDAEDEEADVDDTAEPDPKSDT